MDKRILKARDVERLENTSVVSLLPLDGLDGRGFDVCIGTCEQGACTGTLGCQDPWTCRITQAYDCEETACTCTKMFDCAAISCVQAIEPTDVVGIIREDTIAPRA